MARDGSIPAPHGEIGDAAGFYSPAAANVRRSALSAAGSSTFRDSGLPQVGLGPGERSPISRQLRQGLPVRASLSIGWQIDEKTCRPASSPVVGGSCGDFTRLAQASRRCKRVDGSSATYSLDFRHGQRWIVKPFDTAVPFWHRWALF